MIFKDFFSADVLIKRNDRDLHVRPSYLSKLKREIRRYELYSRDKNWT